MDWALGNGYAGDLYIDRRDNDAHYEPSNCRWVTRLENNRNRRSTRLVSAFGETKTIGEWVEDPRCSVGYDTLYSRIHRGHDPERSIVTPLRSRSALWEMSST